MSPIASRDIAAKIMEIMPLIGRLFDAEMRANDYMMSPVHFHVMNMLSVRPCTLGELAKRQAVSAASMSRTVTVLEERDWVRRVRPAEDRRVVQVELQPAGRDVLASMQEQAETFIAEIFDVLKPDERAALMAALEVVNAHFAAAILSHAAYNPNRS